MQAMQNVRKYERVTFLCRVTLTTGAGVASEASTLDISLGGVGLISRSLVPKGQPVTVGFHLKNSANAPVVEKVQGRVVFVSSDIDGHRLGIEFHEPLRKASNPELTRKVERL